MSESTTARDAKAKPPRPFHGLGLPLDGVDQRAQEMRLKSSSPVKDEDRQTRAYR